MKAPSSATSRTDALLAQRPRLADRGGAFVNTSNRCGLDYRAEAARLPALGYPIIDIHTHINGASAARIMLEAMDLYGIGRAYSMTLLEQVPAVQNVFGDRIRFIAIPDWGSKDRKTANGDAFLRNIERFHQLGARIVKFWQAPRGMDLAAEYGDHRMWDLDRPDRLRAIELAASLGMVLMAHIADPDTWFATKYKDAAKYGTKRSHYEPLEMLLDRYRHRQWFVAHMGGSPESLIFLDELLSEHDNLHLDCSATKWIVRELSKHPREQTLAFFLKWRRRILFGTDIVTNDEQLIKKDPNVVRMSVMSDLADSPQSAAELYASRHFALRAMLETTGDRPSPIADPDLMMVDPITYTALSSPTLRGIGLPGDVLEDLYFNNARRVLGGWEESHR
jgi:predicted TIM-barrel fold metal-dependent hydrolase